MRLFGSSGIRRLADNTLLDMGLKTGLALGRRYASVLVGSDTRTSSPSLKAALIAGLTASGAETLDAGLVPTPTLAIEGKNYDCAVMVTASHNPPQYNGLKLFNPNGSPFNQEQQTYIENSLSEGFLPSFDWKSCTTAGIANGVADRHIALVRDYIPGEYRLRVVADCGGGCATSVIPKLLSKMGCEVEVLNGIPSGFFPRPSEPSEENISLLKNTVKARGAALGLAYDGDADRVVAVDETGAFVPGDILFAILAKEMGAQKIVATVDASMALDELGFSVTRTAVGDNNVSEALIKDGDFGGEPCGAWIFPGISYCPDSIYAAALLVRIAYRNKLSDLAAAVPRYPLRRGSVEGILSLDQIESRLAVVFKPLFVDKTDGLKFKLEDGWLLIRPSGTEPKIRLTAEARSTNGVEYVFEKAMEIIRDSLNK